MKPTGKVGMIRIAILLAVLLITGTGIAETKSPMKPSKSDKCPVCGMFVYKYPDWIAQISFKDGGVVFFDGCKDMFKYYFDLKKYSPDRKIEDIASMYVSDYYNMKPIDAAHAYFVIGSEVYGPMGHELIPLETEMDAEIFKKDHKGKEIVSFQELTPDVLKPLD
jgi:nitrous oxide reductase accessory protein NosL